MFDFAWSEIALIAVVALVVIGPKDLPVAVRAVTNTLKKMRTIAREFQSQLNEVVHEADLGDIHELQNLNVRGHLRKMLDHDGSLERAVTPPDQIQHYSSRYSQYSHYPQGHSQDHSVAVGVKPCPSEIISNTETTETMAEGLYYHGASSVSKEEVQAAPQELPPGVVRRILEERDRLNPPAFLPPVRVLHGQKAVTPDFLTQSASSTGL